jgi:hypothetical protein
MIDDWFLVTDINIWDVYKQFNFHMNTYEHMYVIVIELG